MRGEPKDDLLLEDKTEEEKEPSEEELEALELQVEAEENAPLEVILLDLPGDDIFQRYLNEIDQGPILTREQEVALAKKIKQGDKEAFQTFVQSNLRLVIRIAKRFSGRTRHMNLLDCIQEGNYGLMKAVEKFDWRKGCKLSTYAYWWIRQKIRLAVKTYDRLDRLPVSTIETIKNLQQAKEILEAELGREPSTLEISNFTGWEESEVVFLARKLEPIKSLHGKSSEEKDDREFGETLAGNLLSSAEMVEFSELAKNLKQAIGNLLEEEQKVFLLATVEDLSCAKIAKRLGRTTEEVKGFLLRAKRSLRQSQELKPYKEIVADL